MLSAEEIIALKKERNSLEKELEKIKKPQLHTIVKLSEQLRELMREIKSVREKEKNLWNPDLNTRIKISKKGAGLYKELNYLESDVASEFEKGNISEDAGKRFMSVGKLIKDNRMDRAENEFEYFEKIIELSKRYRKIEEDIQEKDRILRKEQLRIEKILADMRELEKETVDSEKVSRYEELLKNLEKLEAFRSAYINALISKSAVELLESIEKYSLKEHYPPFPGKEELAELKSFFSEYPVFGRCSASQLCEFFGYSEKKLSHVCPETSKFKKVVLGNKNLFEGICSLDKTDFLAVDDENENVMNFYSERIEGAKEVVDRIREMRKEKYSYRQEYEKKERIERKKEELSKYSKNQLEGELGEIKHLIELLNFGNVK